MIAIRPGGAQLVIPGVNLWQSLASADLFKDNFDTTDTAPLNSPRTTEPGPGTITAVQNDGQLSISSGKLNFPIQTTPAWDDLGFYGAPATGSFPRGSFVEFDVVFTTQGAALFGWVNTTAVTRTAMRHVLTVYPDKGMGIADIGNSAAAGTFEYVSMHHVNVTYTVRIIALTGGGALWLIKGGHFGTELQVLGISNAQTDSALYVEMQNQAAVGTMDNMIVNPTGAQTLYVAYYNGKRAGAGQQIGRALSLDGLHWGRQIGNPVITLGGTYDSGHLARRTVLKDGATWKMWYDAYSGSAWSIAYATSSDGITWTKYASNPVFQKTGAGFESNGILFPCVYKDNSDADANKRWKMFYTGQSSGSKFQIGYAYSVDGITWVRGAANPVLANGAGGAIDDEALLPASLVKDGSTYYLFYEADGSFTFPTDGKCCVATFTAFDGTYTKSSNNPLLTGRRASQILTSNLAADGTVPVMTDTSGFTVGESVFLVDAVPASHQNRVAAIGASDTLTLAYPAHKAFNTVSTAKLVSATQSLTPCSVFKIGAVWHMLLTCYAIGSTGAVNETTYHATSNSLDSGWTFDHAGSPPLWLDVHGKDISALSWDSESAENMSIVLDADTNLPITISV